MKQYGRSSFFCSDCQPLNNESDKLLENKTVEKVYYHEKIKTIQDEKTIELRVISR